GRHQRMTAITPRLLTAFSQKGAAMPAPRMMTPASAGPMTRLMLTPMLLSAMAEESDAGGTSSGVMDCQAGVSTAASVPTRKMNSSSTAGVFRLSATNTANT